MADECSNCGKLNGGAVCGDCDGVAEAERRGELKGLETAEHAIVKSQTNAHQFHAQGSALRYIRARIAELKKGGT